MVVMINEDFENESEPSTSTHSNSEEVIKWEIQMQNNLNN